MAGNWGLLEHTADLGIWVQAEGLEELFERAVLALAEVQGGAVERSPDSWQGLAMESPDLVGLLVEFLNEAVYLLDAEGRLVVAAEVEVQTGIDARLTGRLGTVAFDPTRDGGLNAVKAVTYHRAVVEDKDGRWRAEVYLDV